MMTWMAEGIMHVKSRLCGRIAELDSLHVKRISLVGMNYLGIIDYTIGIVFIQLKSFEDYFQAGFSVTFFSCQMMAFMPWSSRNQRE